MIETTNIFTLRAEELLSGLPSTTEPSESEKLALIHVDYQNAVPASPKYRLLECAYLLWALSKKRDLALRLPHPRDTVTACEVCEAPHTHKGWCRKHYYIARAKRSAEAPFASPQPPGTSRGRPPREHTTVPPARRGRPPGTHRPSDTPSRIVRLSAEVSHALDAIRGTSSRSLTVEAILRSALGLEMTPEMTTEEGTYASE